MKKVLLCLFAFCLVGQVHANQERPTVVVIHGFMQNHNSMIPIRNSLAGCGFDVALWNYPSRRYTIECHGSHLADALCSIAAQKCGQPIYFVTHSVGALILRAALNMPQCPAEARSGKAVLIAPVNQGSYLAQRFRGNGLVAFIVGKTGQQLMNMNACDIQNCFGSFPPCMQILVINGCLGTHLCFKQPNDGWVTIEETRLETPYQCQTFRLNHAQLLYSCCSLKLMKDFFCNCP